MKNKIKKVLALILMMFSSPLLSQEINVTLGIGLPFGDNDIMNGNNTGNRWDVKKGDVVGSFIITMPVNQEIDFSLWHHSLLNSDIDDGVSGISLSKTWKFNF